MNRTGDSDIIAVVIPCFRAANTIECVVREIPAGVRFIICVDDASDDGTEATLKKLVDLDGRVEVIKHTVNMGVGGATVSGYIHAIQRGASIIVKLDSDGQMNPAFIPALVAPIRAREADYAKGNRFFDIDQVRAMPPVRLIGNAGLSFLTKLSSGYWSISDPTNGYTAIAANVADSLPLTKLNRRYFFESDMLFRLNCIGAVVVEQPMETRYGEERSHLSVARSLFSFPFLHARNLAKRIFYNYFLRNFDAASLSLIVGLILLAFGIAFGANAWATSISSGIPATAGTVMLSAMPLLIGIQLLLAFLQYDVARTPTLPIHPRIMRRKVLTTPQNERKGKDNDIEIETYTGAAESTPRGY